MYSYVVTARQPFKLPTGFIFGYLAVVIARQLFKLPTGFIFGYLATWGVLEPLGCDASSAVMA